MKETEEEAKQILEETKLQLAKLLGEKVPFIPELMSSGKLLAEHHTFVIQALEDGLDPNNYYNVGSAHPTMVNIQYGSHEEDRKTTTYNYDINGQLKKGTSVALWRLTGLPDYIPPIK